jgi:signal transduction histidine kinase
MHANVRSDRLVSISQRPLLEVWSHLSSHSAKIYSSWLKMLRRFEPCTEYAAVLSALDLTTQIHHQCFAKPQALAESAHRQGMDLAERAVPLECAAAAVGLYVESCLPYLMSNRYGHVNWTNAFIQWASVYQFSLLSGYAEHHAVERHSFEKRYSRADQRLRNFSVQLGEAYEKERRRLAQDLHDEIGHDLVVLKLYTEVIALDLKKGDISQVRRKLKESVMLVKHALQGVRHLTYNLGPAVWNEQGFVPAVRLYVRQFARRTRIKVRLNAIRFHAKLPPRCETALYRVLQGALSNVVSHADAHCIRISLASGREFVSMKVEDDGRGFDVGRKLSAPPHSFGLRAMKERVELLGGSIQFTSRPVRQGGARRGTTIEVHLPLHDFEKS